MYSTNRPDKESRLMGFGSERIWTKVGLVKAGTQPGTTAGALVMLPSPGQGRPCCCHGAGLGQAS